MKMAKNGYKEFINKLIDFAVTNGAERELIREIKPGRIVIPKQWVRWKCSYGCQNFGRKLCCPPYVPTPLDTREFLKEYRKALLIGFKGDADAGNKMKHHRDMGHALVKIEREAFLSGHERAFVLSAGSCYFCDKCIVQDIPLDTPVEAARAQCRHHKLMRPSLEALGVDVFSTVKNAGLELEVINGNNTDNVKHFGILLIE
jgi:predicted metal-binding protein